MFKKMKIGKKLIVSFIIVTLLASLSGIISTFVMNNIGKQYANALVNFGFSQGDIGKGIIMLSENRRAVRDIIGFTDQNDIDKAKGELTDTWNQFKQHMVDVETSLVNPEAKALFEKINTVIPQYEAKRNEIVQLGDTTDPDQSRRAQQMAVLELDPLYNEAYAAASDLMAYKVENGQELNINIGRLQAGSIITIMALIAVSWLLAIGLAIFITRSIATPVGKCASRLTALAKGDLKSDVPHVDSADETGVLADATREIVERLNEVIGDEVYLLTEMGNGNFAVKTRAEEAYMGDFAQILKSLRVINQSLSATLSQINDSSDQVAGGAGQVSDGSQALSQGATEQASSVEELAATVSEIANQVKANADGSVLAKENVNHVASELASSNEKMQELIHAMEDISQSAGEIGKIIKTIEDIAFQTNILALNAAVEAARAGAAGKGFAVVADEVRNLASKSAEASNSTAHLIERSIQSVTNGTQIADETAKSLLAVVAGAQSIVETIDQISEASQNQADAITQVTTGIDQIASVVQTNSATAEESAAASEELSAQAQMLKELVNKFQLRKNA